MALKLIGRPVGFFRQAVRTRPRDLRAQMIAETSAFLSWALAAERHLPRIPRRRVDLGGFSDLLKERAARLLTERWWHRTLELFE